MLNENGGVVLEGTKPLTESESRLVRRTLAKNLSMPPKTFDGVKDEIRVLQRKVECSRAHSTQCLLYSPLHLYTVFSPLHRCAFFSLHASVHCAAVYRWCSRSPRRRRAARWRSQTTPPFAITRLLP